MNTRASKSFASWPLNGKLSRRAVLKGAVIAAGGLVLRRPGLAVAGRQVGTRVNSYVLPTEAAVETNSILTVGDMAAGNGYRMAGIPDGLGAFDNGDGTFTVLMNHEIARPNGVRRAHGSPGAFVSKWTIETDTFRVLDGGDLTPSGAHVHQWDPVARKYFTGTTDWQRLCSADLPDPRALAFEDAGTTERIFFDGEEVNDGRAWARIVTGGFAGTAWQLPRLGRMAFENVVLSPHSRDKTIAIMMDDGALPSGSASPDPATNPSEVYVYVGQKQVAGTPIDQAGLTNGKLYSIRIYSGASDLTQLMEESNDFGLGNAGRGYLSRGRFDLVELGDKGDVSSLSAIDLERDSIAKSAFRFQRPEDGAWDPRFPDDDGRPRDFYFVTTASINNNSRLWRLRFDDISKPEDGGTIEILLNATKGRMFDNITIDRRGRLLLQEDTGNDPWVSKIWLYGIDRRTFTEVAHHDQALFQPDMSPSTFITQDEESSGIIDAESILGPGWFLFDVQVHKTSSDPELVEGGQLLSLYVPLDIR